jgi:hypothetical protein
LHLNIYSKVDWVKEKVAVATVEGKSYYLIVNALREANVPFVSLVPGEPVAAEVKAVITTEKEKPSIKHEKILTVDGERDLEDLMTQVKKILQGKEAYEKIVVGIDPGEATGLAVIADGKVIEEGNCFGVAEVVGAVMKALRHVDFSVTKVSVKVGNGVPFHMELVEALNDALPPQVKLEVVNERGTNLPTKERSRRVRHISSAKRIAIRLGKNVSRRKILAANN